MLRRPAVVAIVAALVAAFALLTTRPALSAEAAAPTRIMPLGDSITGSPGCWRALLWNRLQNAGYTNIDFVGTLGPQGCSVPYDGNNEGHGGILATNMADQNQLPAWLSATRPDIVLMHLGTNDVWSNRSTTTILAAFSDSLIDARFLDRRGGGAAAGAAGGSTSGGWGDEAGLVGGDDGLGTVPGVELGQHVSHVRLHRLHAEHELIGDLRVRPAAGD